jgi:hypothetical protein
MMISVIASRDTTLPSTVLRLLRGEMTQCCIAVSSQLYELFVGCIGAVL